MGEMEIGPELAHAIQAVGVECRCVHGYNSCCSRYRLTEDHIIAILEKATRRLKDQ